MFRKIEHFMCELKNILIGVYDFLIRHVVERNDLSSSQKKSIYEGY